MCPCWSCNAKAIEDSPDSIIPDNEWAHVVWTYNGSHTVLYVNGTQNGIQTGGNTISADHDEFNLCSDVNEANGDDGKFDNIAIFNVGYSAINATDAYNEGVPITYSSTSTSSTLSVNLISPTNNTINNTLEQTFKYNYTYNGTEANSCSLYTNETGNWIINTTDTIGLTENTTLSIPMNFTTDGTYLWNVGCNISNGTTYFADENYTLIIDQVFPSITPDGDLLNNNIFIFNNSLDTQINFTDDREIYSINVTYWNGTEYFGDTDMGVSTYSLNISDTINDYGKLNITVRVCDSHTARRIDRLKTKNSNNKLHFTIDENFFNIDTEWVKIYPKDLSYYEYADTEYNIDRYNFIFEKKTKPSNVETFYVESSHPIDIINSQKFKGHLVIPEIGDKGYWVDFESLSDKVRLKRINDNLIEVKVYGLKNEKMVFNSLGELNCDESTFDFYSIQSTISYDTPVLVGNTTRFGLNLTDISGVTENINTTINYNHTDYFVGSGSTNNVDITSPNSVYGNQSNIYFYWVTSINGTNYTLSEYNQTVDDFYLDDCTDYNTLAINFTYFDEDDSSVVDADITGEFNYGINGIYKEYDLSETAVNESKICIYPNYVSLGGNYSVYYEAATYPQRRYYQNDVTINNLTSEIPLYLLGDAEGIYVRFQVVDSYGTSLEDVSCTMQKEIGGVLTTVERENTDGSGLATFWVDPDTDYVFTFFKSGYPVETQSIRPTSSEIYTVTLGSTAESRDYSYDYQVSYDFSPDGHLDNNTAYDFTFQMISNYWEITDCDLYLINDGSVLSTSGTSFDSSSCDITINYNTGNYEEILSKVVYELNGTEINQSTEYSIWYKYEGQFSLKSFVDDLKDFAGAGFNNFTRMLIGFIILFVIIAGLSLKAEVRDPELLVGIFIIGMWVLSYLGFMTLDYTKIPTEWLKQYLLAIVVSLGGGSFIMRRLLD